MSGPENPLVTPIYLKMQANMPWPDDKFFYLLSSDGLFACRNHKFFRSCAPARKWPSELAGQTAFMVPRYPKLSRRIIERIVGFFSAVSATHGSEAGVLLAWEEAAQQLRIVVPEQTATISRNRWGDTFPIGLHYEAPAELPEGWIIVGDVHSHVNGSAVPSYVDDRDEIHRAGLHIIVGRLNYEPPDFHVEAVVDGARFPLPFKQVVHAYRRRRTSFPQVWMEKIKIKTYHGYYYQKDSYPSKTLDAGAGKHDLCGQGGNGASPYASPYSQDRKNQEEQDD